MTTTASRRLKSLEVVQVERFHLDICLAGNMLHTTIRPVNEPLAAPVHGERDVNALSRVPEGCAVSASTS